MRFRRAEALILDVQPLGDADRIVAFLTREAGVLRGVARGARRRYSRHAGQLQLLSRVDLQWLEKEGRELVRITSVETLRAADALLASLEGVLAASYLAESVRAFAPEGEPQELLFRLLDSTVAALLAGVEPALATRYFEVWLLRLAGVFPFASPCPGCGGALAAGSRLVGGGESLVCASCGGEEGEAVAPGALRFLAAAARSPLGQLAGEGVTEADLAAVERLAAAVRRHFLQHELRSYEVMMRTLGTV